MALVLADRVQETTATTGTGTITLAGAVSGYQSFAAIGNGNTTYYTITSGSAWEVGIGTYSTTGPTLARTTILSSSAAGAAISLTGTSTVFATYPAGKSVNLDGTGTLAIGGAAISAPAWTTSGIGIVQAATTYTDTTSAAGAVSDIRVNVYNAAAVAATNTLTIGTLYGNFYQKPTVTGPSTATAIYAIGAQGIYVSSIGDLVHAGGTTTTQLNNSQSSGTVVVGGPSGTGSITLGQSTVSQTTNIQAGATASGSTKAINIGTGGLSGSTTTIIVGSSFGTSTTVNGTVYSPSTSTAEQTAVASQVGYSGRLWASRTMPSMREAAGAGYAVGAHPRDRYYRQWRFGAGTSVATHIVTFGAFSFTSVSGVAPTIVAPSVSAPFMRGTISTTTVAGNIASTRANTANVGAVVVGTVFHASFCFGNVGSASVATRAFIGLTDVTTAPTNIDPTTASTPGCLGVGLSANTSPGWAIVNNVSGTVRTATILGGSYTTTASNIFYLLDIWSNGTNIYWQISIYDTTTPANRFSNSVVTGTFSANVPASGTLLYPVLWITNNASATAVPMECISVTLETEY